MDSTQPPLIDILRCMAAHMEQIRLVWESSTSIQIATRVDSILSAATSLTTRFHDEIDPSLQNNHCKIESPTADDEVENLPLLKRQVNRTSKLIPSTENGFSAAHSNGIARVVRNIDNGKMNHIKTSLTRKRCYDKEKVDAKSFRSLPTTTGASDSEEEFVKPKSKISRRPLMSIEARNEDNVKRLGIKRNESNVQKMRESQDARQTKGKLMDRACFSSAKKNREYLHFVSNKDGVIFMDQKVPKAQLQSKDQWAATSYDVYRLDRDRVPGWAPRVILPYSPCSNSLNTKAHHQLNYIRVSNLLAFDMKSLNKKFIGVMITPPFLSPECHGEVRIGQVELEVQQLAALKLNECLADNSLICIWTPKTLIGKVLKIMSASWGAKYVENLTWVQLGRDMQIINKPSSFANSAHLTLLIGRRGTGDLELRHQRTPDVIIEPISGTTKVPNAARDMLETLLPPSIRKGKEHGQDKPRPMEDPRLLEICFHGCERASRSGWFVIDQE